MFKKGLAALVILGLVGFTGYALLGFPQAVKGESYIMQSSYDMGGSRLETVIGYTPITKIQDIYDNPTPVYQVSGVKFGVLPQTVRVGFVESEKSDGCWIIHETNSLVVSCMTAGKKLTAKRVKVNF